MGLPAFLKLYLVGLLYQEGLLLCPILISLITYREVLSDGEGEEAVQKMSRELKLMEFLQ